MAGDNIADSTPELVEPKREFKDGERVLLKGIVVLARDASNIVIDAGARFTLSAENLALAEVGVEDVDALDALVQRLIQKRRALRDAQAKKDKEAAEAAKAGKDAKPAA